MICPQCGGSTFVQRTFRSGAYVALQHRRCSSCAYRGISAIVLLQGQGQSVRALQAVLEEAGKLELQIDDDGPRFLLEQNRPDRVPPISRINGPPAGPKG